MSSTASSSFSACCASSTDVLLGTSSTAGKPHCTVDGHMGEIPCKDGATAIEFSVHLLGTREGSRMHAEEHASCLTRIIQILTALNCS
jgi:hypothetical protein